jgi:hypothetical protein
MDVYLCFAKCNSTRKGLRGVFASPERIETRKFLCLNFMLKLWVECRGLRETRQMSQTIHLLFGMEAQIFYRF